MLSLHPLTRSGAAIASGGLLSIVWDIKILFPLITHYSSKTFALWLFICDIDFSNKNPILKIS